MRGRSAIAKRIAFSLLAIFVATGTTARADENVLPILPPPGPATPATPDNTASVQWHDLFKQSLFFLAVEHGFRVATDRDTQKGLGGSFLGGYFNSVSSLHGWADGDPFRQNYVGHPVQGAIAGDLWIRNDVRYRGAEFGRNRRYWTSRLRAMAFAWAYSEQFEIGPLSEASIGHIQSRFPQQGFVDHVVTPTVGMGWLIAEDALDHYVIRRIDNRYAGRLWVRVIAHGVLNPARTFANALALEIPWRSETLSVPVARTTSAPRVRTRRAPPDDYEPFEFALQFNQLNAPAGNHGLSCTGAGGSGTFNLSRVASIEADVSGCKIAGQPMNVSGDLLTFVAGPKLSWRGTRRWTPWVHLLLGGEKVSDEVMDPAQKQAILANPPAGMNPHQLHDLYTSQSSSSGFALQAGGGVDWSLSRNVALQLGNVNYTYTLARTDLIAHPPGLQVGIGMVLRVGD